MQPDMPGLVQDNLLLAAEKHCRDALAFLEKQPGSRRYAAHVVDTLVRALILQGKAEEGLD